MNSPLQIRLTQFMLQQNPSNLISPVNLFKLHSLLITTGLHIHHPSTLLSLLHHYLSNPSTFSHATNLFPQIQQPTKWNLMIRHASATTPLKALSLFQEMRSVVKSNILQSDPFIYASLVKACNKAHRSLEGKSVHCHVIRLGLDYSVNILNSLVSFYMGSADLISYAAVLFDRIPERSVVSVNCMISGHVRRGNLDVGLGLFMKMMSGCFGSNSKPNYVTFVILTSGCVEFGQLKTGNALHCCCCKIGFDWNIEVCNVLIDLYSKFGCLFDAASVFREMPERDLISWNSMILGYANSGDLTQACSLFRKMRMDNIGVDKVSFSCLLSACATRKDLRLGAMIHAHVKSLGLDSDVSVGTALINMYAKCKKIDYAREVFDELPNHNIESWNAMIHAYIEHGLAKEALKLFDRIKSQGLKPDEVTVLGLIMACRDAGELSRGTYMHSIVANNELFKKSVILGNALIDMYAKCGSMEKARGVFDTMPEKDVVSWTSIIVGHAINGEGRKCLSTFRKMCDENFVPNSITFLGLLSACDHAGLVEEGTKLYDIMYEVYNIKPEIQHCGCVVDMLARAGKLEEAEIFIRKMGIKPNERIWRMLMNACRVHGRVNLGLDLVTGIKELDSCHESGDFVISSNIYAEAGRWGDVISQRSFMAAEKALKVVGKSAISYSIEQ